MGRPHLPRGTVRVLLDTHVLLWAYAEPERLSARVRDLLQGGDAELVWSVVGTLEIATKAGRGRLRLEGSVESFLEEQRILLGLDILPVENVHAVRAGALPPVHGDPLDRLLVAQALVEGLPLVTADSRFRAYGVEVIW